MKFVKSFPSFIVTNAVALSLLTIILTSCSKNKNDVAAPSSLVVGRWVGEQTSTNGADTFYISLDIKANGAVNVVRPNGIVEGSGSWSLKANAFTATVVYPHTIPLTLSLVGTLENQIKLSGVWGTGGSKTNGGFWHMAKQP